MTEKEATFLSAYLVVGNDELKAATIIKRLWSRLEKLGDLDFNSQIFEGTKEIDCIELLDSLNTPPLLAPFRVVLIKDVDKVGKELTEKLIEYLQSPMPTTVLLMTAKKLTQQSRLYKAVNGIDKKAVIDASELKRSELPAMVKQLAHTYQISISQEAAVKLSELVGSSTIALNTEVKKLAGYVVAKGHSEAGLSDVMTVVTRSNQPSAWDFVEAFSRRELVLSLELLKLMPRESPISLLYLCVTRLRELLQYKSLAARQDGKLNKALGKQEWQIKRLANLAHRFDESELRALLSTAAKLDVRMKSGEDARRALEEFILITCH